MTPTPPPAPPNAALAALPPARPAFFSGLRALFGGLGFVFSTPAVWPLALVPLFVGVALTGLLGWAAVAFVPPAVASLLGEHGGGLLEAVLEVVATALALLAAALVAFALAQPLSGPALERIVRRVEASRGAPAWPPTSFVTDVLRSLESIVVTYAFGLPILAVLFVIDMMFPPAAVVTIPIKLLVAALVIAWDLCDYPLSIRGIPVTARVAFMRRNAAAMLGFGVGLALLGLLPCLLFLALPAGVAGAARLVVDIERWEAASGIAPRR